MKNLDRFPEYQETIYKLQHIQANGQPRFCISISPIYQNELHHHDYAELSYYFEGTGTETINTIHGTFRPGTASFKLPHHLHQMHSDSGETYTAWKYSVLFDMELLFGTNDDVGLSVLLYGIGTTLSSFVHFDEAMHERMKAILDSLMEEFLQPDTTYRRHMIRAKLTEALLLFVRFGNDPFSASGPSVPEERSTLFWSIMQYVHVHFSDDIHLDKISSLFHCSAPYISRLFKKNIGKGFLEYVHELRIESASTLLLHTNMTVIEVAHEVGFDSSRTFSRVFRDLKGLTASEYRHARRT
ncbi:AraC family transcriptional regulator [Paenibacillus hodogayensis]|uniref:AraC family transcriptional regulator n=1 Tax=Paenibacillus hodogayensis TaxID=279208 RepID=A0ABV5W4J3_9BACL